MFQKNANLREISEILELLRELGDIMRNLKEVSKINPKF